jgi:membrane fusion protein (multidrug efflux system)
MIPTSWFRGAALAAAGAIIAGCAKEVAKSPPPAEVQVVKVTQQDVPITQEWVGYLDGMVNAQIRAQVTGYLVKQNYAEGDPVKAGDPMFEIDPRPFEAAVAQAQAVLDQAQARLVKANQDVTRYGPLAKDQAISQEELDDAVQAQLGARAEVAAAQAALDTAKVNLGFTHITSPIDGVAGLVRGQIGDLVGPGTGNLTTVNQLDPIKAYFPISEQSYLDFRSKDNTAAFLKAIAFQLILANGSVYPLKGAFYAIDSQVDANTGTLRVVATFPNPQGLLRPGQFARVRAVVRTEKGALLVPQRALSELQGGFQVATVDAGNQAHIVPVVTGPTVGNLTVIERGLHPGDQVVADGVQKIRDGTVVAPKPFNPPAGS